MLNFACAYVLRVEPKTLCQANAPPLSYLKNLNTGKKSLAVSFLLPPQPLKYSTLQKLVTDILSYFMHGGSFAFLAPHT